MKSEDSGLRRGYLNEKEGLVVTPEQVVGYFTADDGSYRFARWGRPIVPVVFGVEDTTLAVVKGAIEAVVALAGHSIADSDPEFGANLMVFFLRDWSELADLKDMDQLVPDLSELLGRLDRQRANQYRLFRFDEAGAIKACFVFLRMDASLADMAAEDIALSQVVQVILVWGRAAFGETSPLARLSEGEVPVLRPEVAGLIRVGYDPVLPVAAEDPSHALRLSARLGMSE